MATEKVSDKIQLKNLKLLITEIDFRIDEFQKEIHEEIERHHVHLTDGIPCIAVKMVNGEMWQLNEAKGIIKTILKELEKA